jgi:hypothetical protein
MDENHCWAIPFSLNTVQECCPATPPQYHYMVLSCLTDHLDSTQEYLIKANIVAAVVSIYRAPVGPIFELMSALFRHLIDSLEADVPGRGTPEAQNDLQVSIFNCLGVISKRIQDSSQKLDAISFICDRFFEVELEEWILNETNPKRRAHYEVVRRRTLVRSLAPVIQVLLLCGVFE